MRSPVRWYGGKGQMVAKLLPLLPPHITYVEPFGGGGSILFAKAPAPVEVYNDIDSGVVNFYRVLRNPALFAEFVRLVHLTPYSREDWEACRATWADEADPVQRAYKWFVWVRQQVGGGGQQWGGWQLVVTESSRNMAANVANWLQAVDHLPAVHARLQRVQIEHQDWRGILAQYDTPDTLFYCDPPYLLETRGRHRYGHELSAADHADLVAALLGLQGMAVLSGYAHPVYAPLEAAGWQRQDWAVACNTVETGSETRPARVESVWMSPRCWPDFGPLFNRQEGAA